MTRHSILTAIAALAVLVLTGPALTDTAHADTAHTDTRDGLHYGPYPFSGDPTDIGTCGAWATDTFTRSFDVHPNQDGTLSVRTRDHGTFITMAGPSPNACDPRTGDGGVGRVAAGISGQFTGSIHYHQLAAPNFNPDGCDGDTCKNCADWVHNVLGPGVRVVGPVTFNLEYTADPGQQLIKTRWHNASPELGGNHGDIRST